MKEPQTICNHVLFMNDNGVRCAYCDVYQDTKEELNNLADNKRESDARGIMADYRASREGK